MPAPTIYLKQNDLAATSLLVSVALGEPTPERRVNLIPVLIATCRNLGTQTYKPGFRALRIYHTVNGVDHVVAASFIPQLGPGKTFSISYYVPQNDEDEEIENGGYWMEVSEGPRPDEDPANDSYAEDHHILGETTGFPMPIGNRN